MPQSAMTRDKVSNEALFILRSLQENARTGKSNKLADVKVSLESNVSLEFDSYFFFLRKFHYIAMDREAQLKLTDTGEKVVDGDHLDKFATEVGEFFSDQLMPADATDAAAGTQAMEFTSEHTDPQGSLKPPPPTEDLILEEHDVAPPNQQPSKNRKGPPAPPPEESGAGTLGNAPIPTARAEDVKSMPPAPPPAAPTPAGAAKGSELDVR